MVRKKGRPVTPLDQMVSHYRILKLLDLSFCMDKRLLWLRNHSLESAALLGKGKSFIKYLKVVV